MTPSLIALPAARLELIAAQDWYEQASGGLGRAFRAEVDREVGRILACFHGSRDPLVWKARL